jgi:hypothetical protein
MLASFRSGPDIRRRMASMTSVWLFLGMVLGIHTGWRLHAGPVAIVSHAIAGSIVLAFLGIAISILADRWRESLIGGLGGMLFGAVAELWNCATPAGQAVNMGLLIGALVGATCWPWITLAWKILHGIKSGLAFVMARFRSFRASTNLQ